MAIIVGVPRVTVPVLIFKVIRIETLLRDFPPIDGVGIGVGFQGSTAACNWVSEFRYRFGREIIDEQWLGNSGADFPDEWCRGSSRRSGNTCTDNSGEDR